MAETAAFTQWTGNVLTGLFGKGVIKGLKWQVENGNEYCQLFFQSFSILIWCFSVYLPSRCEHTRSATMIWPVNGANSKHQASSSHAFGGMDHCSHVTKRSLGLWVLFCCVASIPSIPPSLARCLPSSFSLQQPRGSVRVEMTHSGWLSPGGLGSGLGWLDLCGSWWARCPLCGLQHQQWW